MASDRPSYGWQATSAEQKTITLPDKFLCRDCKKFKPPTLFSKKELNGFRWKKANNPSLSGITGKIRCRSCAGDQAQELHCQGPCGLWRGLDEYSKAQRRHPEDAWCLVCTQWKEANEPGITPSAPPNKALAPDEEKTMTEEETGFASYSGFDPDGEAESEEDGDGGPGYIYGPMSAMSLGGAADGEKSSAKASALDSTADHAPPSLFGLNLATATNKTLSSMSNPYEARSDYSADSGGFGAEGSGLTSPNNENKIKVVDRSSPYVSTGGWIVADRKRREPGISYNAWDSSGQAYNRIRLPSTTDAASSGVRGSSSAQVMSSAPSLSFVPVIPTARGAWAKQTSRATPVTQFPPISRPVQSNYYDDYDDEDEM